MDYFHPHFAKETKFQKIKNVTKIPSKDLRPRADIQGAECQATGYSYCLKILTYVNGIYLILDLHKIFKSFLKNININMADMMSLAFQLHHSNSSTLYFLTRHVVAQTSHWYVSPWYPWQEREQVSSSLCGPRKPRWEVLPKVLAVGRKWGLQDLRHSESLQA